MSGWMPRDASTRAAAVLTVRMAGCVCLVSVSWSSGPSKHRLGQRTAERRVGLLERRPRFGERLGQRAAHADLLRSLSGKEECDQRRGHRGGGDLLLDAGNEVARREPVAPWQSRCESAFADDRPWPTIARPATPSSGAPPYSE